MRGGVSDLLDAWEQALPERPVARALALLAATSGVDAGDLAELSLGERDRLLFALRERLFGTRLSSLATCPGCAETVELACETGDLAIASDESEPPTAATGRAMRLVDREHEVVYRRLTSADLLALHPKDDPEVGRRQLIDRCILGATRAGAPLGTDELPAAVRDAAIEAMAVADAQADVQINLSCPACGTAWQAVFDIAGYLWSEVEAWAQRILVEVHKLASRYGWTESAILSMTPWRRQIYLSFEDA